jgi:hypothetical protein
MWFRRQTEASHQASPTTPVAVVPIAITCDNRSGKGTPAVTKTRPCIAAHRDDLHVACGLDGDRPGDEAEWVRVGRDDLEEAGSGAFQALRMVFELVHRHNLSNWHGRHA